MAFIAIFIAIIQVASLVVLSSSSVCGLPERRPTALIHHPKVALDYALKTQKHSDCEYLQKFRNLEKPDRLQECLYQLVDAISFSIPQDHEDYITDDFAGLVKETQQTVPNPYIESLSYRSIDGELRKTAAQICIDKGHRHESWAISAGCHEGVSIVYKKSEESTEFELFGLLEEMPIIEPDLTQFQLDHLYVTGRTNYASEDEPQSFVNEQNTRSLCDLDDNERFRVCAVGYLAWKHSWIEFPSYQEGNYINQDTPVGQPRCIKSKIVFDIERTKIDSSHSTDTISFAAPKEEKSSPKSSLMADILPCSINMEAKYAAFFLTNDRIISDSMFSVEPQWKYSTVDGCHSVGDEIEGFELEFHMKNVKALKPW